MRMHKVLFACPRLYARVLRISGRGSVEKRALLGAVRRGFTVVEVGANDGIYTSLISVLVGGTGAVHAFEPVAAAFAELKRRLERDRCPSNVTLSHAALGDAEGETRIIVPGDDRGQASLREHHAGSWRTTVIRRTERCRMTTLDGYCEGFERLDLVKIDVEGAELLVLRGGRRTLGRHAPLIFVEVFREWTRAFGFAPADVLEELRRLGYDCIRPPDDRLLPGRPIDFSRPVDLLCRHRRTHGCIPAGRGR